MVHPHIVEPFGTNFRQIFLDQWFQHEIKIESFRNFNLWHYKRYRPNASTRENDIPLERVMMCCNDTYSETSKRGCGALLASLNDNCSCWYAKAYSLDRMGQIFTELEESLTEVVGNYRKINSYSPNQVLIYCGGDSEDALALLFPTELEKICRVLHKIDPNIKLTLILVNKQLGARFYMRQGNSPVTRLGFYLVSQSTRGGTITPTFYDIIHDENDMMPEYHQKMACKLSRIYFNLMGTVRLPAPYHYAHKFASLCGKHLEAQPNAVLNDSLHFL